MTRLTLLATLVAICTPAGCASSALPVSTTSASPPRPSEASPERRRNGFAQSYVDEVAAETAMVRASGLGDEWDQVRPIVAAHFPAPTNPPPVDPSDAPAIFEARIDRAANFLLRTGYRARHLANELQARAIVRSAEITAWDDADALVRIAPMVVVAALDRVDRNADGSEDLVYRVTERIKSGPPIGAELRFQLHAAPLPLIGTGAPPPPPPPNPPLEELGSYKSAVLFLKPTEAVVIPPGAALASQPARLFGSMPISGDQVLPSYHSSTRPTTLEALRAASQAQQCSPGYVPVVPDAIRQC